MKITNLKIQGYRSLKSIEWKPGDLNVLIGQNASGKTNLLRALQMLNVAAQGGLKKYIQREGGMDAILWDGQVDELDFDVSLDTEKVEGPVIYDLSLGKLGSDYYTPKEELSIQSKLIISGDDKEKEWDLFDPHHFGETLLSNLNGLNNSAQNILANEVKHDFSNWSIYQHFRTDRKAEVRRAQVTSNDIQVEPDGQNLITVLHTLYTNNREFEREINAAMQSAFGDEFEKLIFPPAADQRIQMRIRWNSLKREQSTADISDGTLRFLYLITILANPAPPALIAIDEPETGLHPSMLPIVAEYAREASNRTQIIFSTHSPEFLDAFDKEPPTTTIVELIDGKTKLRVLADKDLRYWIKNYTLGELQRSGELEAMP